MEKLLQDLAYALRTIRKAPAVASVVVLTLAPGIGATTAVFSLIHAILWRPLPVEDAKRLVAIYTTDEKNPGNLPVAHLNFLDYRSQNPVFSDVAGIAVAQVNRTSTGEPEQLAAEVVSGNYFSTLGVRPAIGRLIGPEDDETQGAHAVAVLSHGFWTRRLGSDRGAVGKTLVINRQAFTIVGVAPEGFHGTFLFRDPDLWVPMSMHDVVQPGFDWYGTRRGLFLSLVGRLRPDVDLDQARAAMTSLAKQLETTYPNDNQGRSVRLLSLIEARLDPNADGTLVRESAILFGIVAVVLLIACANVANVLLARATGRRREIAVRLALGAGRGRLVRQLLTESLLLGLVGGAVGLALGAGMLRVLTTRGLPLPFPVPPGVELDLGVLGFTLALSIATGVLFGLAPAVLASRAEVVPVLKNEAVLMEGGSPKLGVRKILVVAEVALSLLALMTAALFIRSFRQARGVDPGFDTEKVLVMAFNLGREGYTPERGAVFYHQVVERVSALAGVQSAAMAQNPPFGGGIGRSVFFETQDGTARDRVLMQVNYVGPRYFETLGIPLQKGRDFTESDRKGSPPVVIINETMANRFWPGQDPVGRRFKFFGENDYNEIVGVVRDVKYNGLVEEPQPFIYEALAQDYRPTAALHVRARNDARALIAAVRKELQALDPSLSVWNVQTLSDRVERSLAGRRASAFLLTLFGVLALLLASVGIYGVTAYSVSRRTREIGVRIALGAGRQNVMRMVIRESMSLVLVGAVLGGVACLSVARLFAGLLFQVEPADPATLGATSLALAAIALAATYVPARRATRVDPLTALRYE